MDERYRYLLNEVEYEDLQFEGPPEDPVYPWDCEDDFAEELFLRR